MSSHPLCAAAVLGVRESDAGVGGKLSVVVVLFAGEEYSVFLLDGLWCFLMCVFHFAPLWGRWFEG